MLSDLEDYGTLPRTGRKRKQSHSHRDSSYARGSPVSGPKTSRRQHATEHNTPSLSRESSVLGSHEGMDIAEGDNEAPMKTTKKDELEYKASTGQTLESPSQG